MNLTVSVHSDLYEAGTTEDGQVYSAELYYVVVEDSQGRRKAHVTSFKGCMVEHHDDGVMFHDVRGEALHRANMLRDRVEDALQRGESLNDEYWTTLPHAYGSYSYQFEGGDEEMTAWEKSHG